MTSLEELLRCPADKDRIYHFTKAAIAIESILGDQKLRFSCLQKTNDPLEFETFAVSVAAEPRSDRGEVDRLCDEAVELADVKKRCKLACFTCDQDSSESSYKDIFDKGYCLPSMWSQYADNHAGVCLVFSREHLLERVRADVAASHCPGGEVPKIFSEQVSYSNDLNDFYEATSLEISADQYKDVSTLVEERVGVMLFRKFCGYEHEHEFRMVIYSDCSKPEDEIYVGYGDALEGIILGVRFKCVDLPPIAKLAVSRKIPVLRMRWSNGNPELISIAVEGEGSAP
jgi:Protein of unknown function (DUF2971)